MSQNESKEPSIEFLTDEKWNELARKVKDEVKQKGVLVFPDHKNDQLRDYLCQITKKDDFYSIYPMLRNLMRSGSLPAEDFRWKGILAMAASSSEEQAVAWQLAKEVYTEQPRYGLAYGTVAHAHFVLLF